MAHQVVAFLGIATLLTVTPGADMALVTRNVLRGSVRSGLETSLGILSGLVVWAALAGVGIAAILAASASAFTALKIAGAAYLIYLGLVTVWRTRGQERAAPDTETPNHPTSFASNYRQGLLSNLFNVKVGIFYTTFLPQFIEPGGSAAAWTAGLAALHIAMGVAWLAFYSWFVGRVRDAVQRPAVRRVMDRVTGTILVAFGVRVANTAR